MPLQFIFIGLYDSTSLRTQEGNIEFFLSFLPFFSRDMGSLRNWGKSTESDPV